MQTHALMLFACAVALGTVGATAADDVQRQLQQRELHQLELRLKMQQQIDRAAQPPQGTAADLRQRQVERDQHQRLRQSHDQEVRRAIPPASVGGTEAQGEVERRRGIQAGAEQLKRFDAERRLNTDTGARR